MSAKGMFMSMFMSMFMKNIWIVLLPVLLVGCGDDDKTGQSADSESESATDGDSSSMNSIDSATTADTQSAQSDSNQSSDPYSDTSHDTGMGTDSVVNGDSDTSRSNAQILYNGESVTFERGEAWDGSSSISESATSPYSDPNHIRANLVTQDGWGAVVYYFGSASSATQDWTTATRWSLQAKADQAGEVELALVFVNGNEYGFESSATLQLGTTYQAFDIDVAAIADGVDLAQVAGMILFAGAGQYVVDVDDVAVTMDSATADTETVPDTASVIDTGTGSASDTGTGSASDTGTGNASDTETATATGPNELVHYFGRFDTREPNSPGCAWTYCGAGVSFEGDALDVLLSGAGGISFQVVLDGELHAEITTEGGLWNSRSSASSYRIVENVSAGPHSVQIYRNPEAMFGAVKFHGFEAPSGTLVASQFPFSRKIEIIGDSISAGYGNAGCPWAPENEIGSATWGALAARSLGAIAHVVAWSGIGMVMDYGGETDNQMPELYGYALPEDTQTPWDYSSYIPDVVIVNLGTNDFNGGVNSATYTNTYQEFVTRLRGYYPDALILLAINLTSDPFSDELDDVIANLGDSNVEKINLNIPSWGGCDGHPDLAAHQAMADTLVTRLREEMGW